MREKTTCSLYTYTSVVTLQNQAHSDNYMHKNCDNLHANTKHRCDGGIGSVTTQTKKQHPPRIICPVFISKF